MGLRGWLVLLVCALLAGVAGVFGVWYALRDQHLPPIARQVPYASIDGNLVFSSRVTQHFPVGMKIGELRAELKLDGFTLDPPEPVIGDGTATLVRKDMLCRRVWHIAWEANEVGRVGSVTGSFDRRCIWD